MTAVERRRRRYMMFAKVHGWVVVRTGGRPSHLSHRLRCLVLETVGRRSQQIRRVPLLFMPEGDSFIVIASNFGQEHPPSWWFNLRAKPEAAVLLSGRRIEVRWRELAGTEREEILERAAAYNKQWRSYRTTVSRTLPIVRLEPLSPTT